MKPKYSKGQLNSFESVAVVIIVIVLLFLGIAFWSKANAKSIQDTESESQDLSAIELANMIPEMSELKCYDLKVSKVKCLDWYRMLAMSNSTSNDAEAMLLYNDYFKNARIVIAELYPEVKNVTLYDAKPATASKTLLIRTPVNIWNDVNKTTAYGEIIVEGYFNEQG